MITIKYRIENKKWLKNGKITTQKQIKSELTLKQLNKLQEENELTIRKKTEEEIEKKNKKNENKQKEKNKKLVNSVRENYRIEKGFRRGKSILEVWRKNTIYGYYNFAFYLDDISNLDDMILKDIIMQEDIKNKKNILNEED